ncbi:MAG: CapA family protein [Chloroflexi bacterium]|nr:CapA family protein [Chloroflexota bacterium]
MRRSPLLVVLGLFALAIAVPLTVNQLRSGSPSGSPSAIGEPAVSATPGRAAGTPFSTASPGTVVSPAPATPAPTDRPLGDVAIVPVTHFRATVDQTTRTEVAAVLAGTSKRYEALELVVAEADAILAALGVERPVDPARLIVAPDAASLARDLATSRKRLAFMRADAVGPGVRALAWAGRSLFGVDRVKKVADWALTARLPEPTEDGAFDPAATWTMFAGGDILLDRGVYQTIRIKGKGVDFPFDGGSAEITGHTCCSQFGWKVPITRRTGGAGAVRELMTKADLAIANFENPAPDVFRWHTSGTTFSADPRIIDGLERAGIDYVSLANNHIGDAGRIGVLQTIANLDKRGIKHSGAGKDLKAARRPGMLEANGTKVAILAYDAIAGYYNAGREKTGSAPLKGGFVKSDIEKARAAGAEVVIVFPHWGAEYQAKPFESQQRLARQIVEAGADMVIGNHAHWAAALEIHEGAPIWYALGNFVFDQTWSEPTMEGITLELTFDGAELVQARMRPHIIVDKAQPNFMDPTGDGRVVMGQVYGASRGLLPW